MYEDASNIMIMKSANYPEISLKFYSYVFVLTALKIGAKSALELWWWEWAQGARHP